MEADAEVVPAEAPVERYEYDDARVLAVDVGAERDAAVDVIDGTAIVVAGGEQAEFDLPDGDAEALIRNGVLTVEVAR
jgi:putative intracellular protease/amidase